jgi:hypothetical protein
MDTPTLAPPSGAVVVAPVSVVVVAVVVVVVVVLPPVDPVPPVEPQPAIIVAASVTPKSDFANLWNFIFVTSLFRCLLFDEQ